MLAANGNSSREAADMIMIRSANNDSLNSSIDSRVKDARQQLTDQKRNMTSVSINNSLDLKQQQNQPISFPGTPSQPASTQAEF